MAKIQAQYLLKRSPQAFWHSINSQTQNQIFSTIKHHFMILVKLSVSLLDKTKSYQPRNKAVLSNFFENWFRICKVNTDILTRALPLSMCRGQAFDGATNMRNTLATKIRREMPHCLNLCLQNAGQKLQFLGIAERVRENVKLIRFPPKQAHLFPKKKKN